MTQFVVSWTHNLENQIQDIPSFDKRAQGVFKSYTANRLEAQDAEKIVQIAVERFGREGGEWVVDQVKESFSYTEASFGAHGAPTLLGESTYDSFYDKYSFPQSQLRVLKLFINTFNCPKNAIKIIGLVDFYNTRDKDEVVHTYLDDENQEIANDTLADLLVEPIQLFSDRFGEEATKEVISMSRSHPRIRNAQQKIETYFDQRFPASKGWVKKKFSSSCVIL